MKDRRSTIPHVSKHVAVAKLHRAFVLRSKCDICSSKPKQPLLTALTFAAESAQTEEDIITPSHIYPQIKRWWTLEYKMLLTVNRTAALIQAPKRDASVSSKSDVHSFFFLNHKRIIWNGQRVYKRRGEMLLRSNNKHNNSKRTTALVKVHEGLHLFILDWQYLKISVCWCNTKWVIIAA